VIRRRKSASLRKVSIPRSKRKTKPISDFFKKFFRISRRKLRIVLRGGNLGYIPQNHYSVQSNILSFLKRRFIAKKLLALFREYAATIVVAVCVALVALINLSSSKNWSGSFFGGGGQEKKNDNTLKNKLSIQSQKRNNLAVVPLTDPAFLAAEESTNEENYLNDVAAYYNAPTIESQVVLATYSPSVSRLSSHEERTYVVQSGDTVGSIAAKNGISTNTILWTNNLSDTSLIKPGDKLAILPVTGVKYKVQKSDNIDAIANKYNADKAKVLAYNQLPADGSLRQGQALIIPDGYISTPNTSTTATGGVNIATAPTVRPTVSYGVASTAYRMDVRAGVGHAFPFGYCTWYVSQRKYVPWSGNAGTWLASARAYGKATGRMPRPGAIMVSAESRWGHVAVVESVSGSSFTVSEMNYAGFGRKDFRTISINSPVVKGFIY
jgi:surface antigen/LysM repeat protein